MESIIQSIKFWAPFLIILWLLGYILTKVSEHEDQFISVPQWLFYICGAPKSKGLRATVLTRQGASLQILGFLIFLSAICIGFLVPEKNLSRFIVIWLSLILSLIFMTILRKTSHFK